MKRDFERFTDYCPVMWCSLLACGKGTEGAVGMHEEDFLPRGKRLEMVTCASFGFVRGWYRRCVYVGAQPGMFAQTRHVCVQGQGCASISMLKFSQTCPVRALVHMHALALVTYTRVMCA